MSPIPRDAERSSPEATIRIHAPELAPAEGTSRVGARVECGRGDDVLWFGVEQDLEPHLCSDRADAFLVTLLPLALTLGEDVHVMGRVSARLLYHLREIAVPVLSCILPGARSVRIHATDVADDPGPRRGGGVATGFSGGVDSFSLIADHLGPDVPPSYRPTHLLLLNVGSHGEWEPQAARRLFRARYELLASYPEELGLPFVAIDSNAAEILQMHFGLTFLTSSTGAVLALQGTFSKYLIAGSHAYAEVDVRPTTDYSDSDPVLAPLLSTDRLECLAAGCQFTRPEKTERILDVPATRRLLNVCVQPDAAGRNCSTCYKCCRTQLTLEILGRLDEFAAVFDLAAYRRVRTFYVLQQFARPRRSLNREVLDLAAVRGIHFPLWQRALGRLCSLTPRGSAGKLSTFARTVRG